MISIAATGLVQQVLQDYEVWSDHQKFVASTLPTPVLQHSDGWPCYHYNQIQHINSDPHDTVVIDNLTEGWHTKPALVQYRSDKHYLIFTAGWWDVDQVHLPFSYDLVYYPYWLMEMVDVSLSPHRFCFHQNRRYTYGPKDFLFTCIAGGKRPVRDQLVSAVATDLRHHAMILKYAGNWLRSPPDHCKDIMDLHVANYSNHAQINPRYHYHVGHAFYTDLLDQSYFNLVIETNFDMDQHSWFLTEKTLKAMLCGVPFVVAATPGFLQGLRRMGFKTYDSIWDESYDNILDHQQRLCAIIQLCDDLSRLDWLGHQAELLAIRNHNFAVFANLGQTVHDCFSRLSMTLANHGSRHRH